MPLQCVLQSKKMSKHDQEIIKKSEVMFGLPQSFTLTVTYLSEPSFIQLEPKSKKVQSWDEKFNHHPVMHTKTIIHGGAQWDEHFNHHRHNALSQLYWVSYIDYVSSF